MEYTEVKFYNEPSQNEVLLAFLSDSGFEMFEENDDGLLAYIPTKDFSIATLGETLAAIPEREKIRYEILRIEDQNWNQLWESNFEPVTVSNRIYIRAPFHPSRNDVEFEIVIEPKMSFGTGHHATTALVAEQMLKFSVKGKSVLDMGCGTSLLAILAAKMGSTDITAIDIDDWCVVNSLENIRRNNVEYIHVHKGDASILEGKIFDIILANINRNVLIRDIPFYVQSLSMHGILVISGFLETDIHAIDEVCTSLGLKRVEAEVLRDWVVLRYTIPNVPEFTNRKLKP